MFNKIKQGYTTIKYVCKVMCNQALFAFTKIKVFKWLVET